MIAPPLHQEVPPLLAPAQSSLPRWLVILLSLCLATFLADGLVSFLDDCLILFTQTFLLGFFRGLVTGLFLLLSAVTYLAMGLTPMIPKRGFLPVVWFYPVTLLALIPILIYHYAWLPQLTLAFSLCQMLVGLAVLAWARPGHHFTWPLVAVERLRAARFSWANLVGFILVNGFVVVPVLLLYCYGCVTLAVDHFSAGFVALRPSGFTVQARKYVRDDGKVVQLYPMVHVAEQTFYESVARAIPTNAIILMEGVTDDQGLLTNHLTYKRAAHSLGVAEQHEAFQPEQGELVPADVDVAAFRPATLGFLNTITLFQSRGLTPEVFQQLLQYSPPPNLERELLEDLLHRRNQHLLDELEARLATDDEFVLPWGAAHMPGLEEGIKKLGFHPVETREYEALRFRHSQTAKRPGHRLKSKSD